MMKMILRKRDDWSIWERKKQQEDLIERLFAKHSRSVWMLSEIAMHVYKNFKLQRHFGSLHASASDSRPRSHEGKEARKKRRNAKAQKMCGEAKERTKNEERRRMKGMDETCRRFVMDRKQPRIMWTTSRNFRLETSVFVKSATSLYIRIFIFYFLLFFWRNFTSFRF